MNVLSLFDGISCGQIALNRAGIKYDKYFASEIEKSAIKVTQANYPNTIQLGDVTKISVKSFFLSEVGSIFGVDSIDDTDLQNTIPEWEMLYWLNKEFSATAEVRAQESDERLKIQSPDLQRAEEIRFSKRGVGDIIRTRNIERCRASRNSSNQEQYSELQCGDWWYVYRSNPRDSKKNFTGANRKEGFGRDEGETSAVRNSPISIRGIKDASIGENQGVDERSSVEKELSRGAKENRHEETGREEKGNGSEKESNPLSHFDRELQRRNEVDRTIKDNKNFLSIHPKTQITVVKYKNGIIIFNGVFQILLGGSPCQGFSFAGKQLNLEDPRSKLFFEYSRILKECQPKWFLLENVLMHDDCKKIISETLGVEPVLIDSADFCAQRRKRLYWTNIPISDHEVLQANIKDIIEELPNAEYHFIHEGLSKDGRVCKSYLQYDGSGRGNRSQNYRAYFLNNKMGTLSSSAPHGAKILLENGRIRYTTRLEHERLQTLPPDYTSCLEINKAKSAMGNGWTVDVITHIFKGMI